MKKSHLIISALSIALIITLSSSMVKGESFEKSKQKIYSNLDKSFYELIENVEKIDLSLKKAALSGDSYSLLDIGATIRESASISLFNISQMESDSPLTNINTFFNQSGDYVKAVALSHSDGSSPTKNEQDTFLALSRFSEALKNELYFLRGKIASGEISYSAALEKADETLGTHLSRIEKEHFSDYEALTYDGAFSGHMTNSESDYLPSFPEVSKEEAQKYALGYLYNSIPFIYTGETGGEIPSYVFYAENENSRYGIEVSKNGGKLLYYSESRVFKDPSVSIDEAIYHALSFTSDAGFPDMTPVFYESSGATLTVTLAPLKDEVIHYSDIIKLEVALDDASIVGFNSEKYLMNHKDRTFPISPYDINSIVSRLNPDFFVKSLKSCFIPTEYGKDVPCIEISGNFDNKAFLIYLNAESGIQEEVLLLSVAEESYFAM